MPLVSTRAVCSVSITSMLMFKNSNVWLPLTFASVHVTGRSFLHNNVHYMNVNLLSALDLEISGAVISDYNILACSCICKLNVPVQ